MPRPLSPTNTPWLSLHTQLPSLLPPSAFLTGTSRELLGSSEGQGAAHRPSSLPLPTTEGAHHRHTTAPCRGCEGHGCEERLLSLGEMAISSCELMQGLQQGHFIII